MLIPTKSPCFTRGEIDTTTNEPLRDRYLDKGATTPIESCLELPKPSVQSGHEFSFLMPTVFLLTITILAQLLLAIVVAFDKPRKIINMNKLLPITLAMLVGTGFAHANCKQVDAKGTWVTYQAAFITAPNGQHVGQCNLVVDKSGYVDQGSSYCEFVTFNTPQIPTDGKITVNKDCSADIALGLGNLVGQVQLAKNKQTFSGRFSAQGGAVSGTTSGVKR